MALFGKKLFGEKRSAEGLPEAEKFREKKSGEAKIGEIETGASVKILGSGCAKCNQLEAAARDALEQLGMDPAIDHVTDFARIAAYGVMTTPALVVDGKVVSTGKVLRAEEVVKLLQKARG